MGQDPKQLRSAASAAAHVTQMCFAVIFGTLAGARLDEHFGTAPWLILVGSILGMAIGITFLIRSSKESQTHEPDDH